MVVISRVGVRVVVGFGRGGCDCFWVIVDFRGAFVERYSLGYFISSGKFRFVLVEVALE